MPSSYRIDEPMPLVIALHGFSRDPDYIEGYLGLEALAESEGFLLAQPDGLRSTFDGRVGWNDGVPLFDEVQVAVEIESTSEVERVELRFDGGLVDVKTSPPWVWTVDVGPRNRDRTFYVDVVTTDGRSERAEFTAARFVADEEIDRAFYGDISVSEAADLSFNRTEEYFLIAQFARGR